VSVVREKKLHSRLQIYRCSIPTTRRRITSIAGQVKPRGTSTGLSGFVGKKSIFSLLSYPPRAMIAISIRLRTQKVSYGSLIALFFRTNKELSHHKCLTKHYLRHHSHLSLLQRCERNCRKRKLLSLPTTTP
jgi:hypothetical protein